MQMRTVVTRKNSPLAMLLCLLTLVAGCGIGSANQSLLAIAPNTAQTMDAGQTLPILVSVVNDPLHKGAATSISGIGSLSTGPTTILGYSEQTTSTYTPPTTVASASTVTFTATSNGTPSQTANLTITVNPALVITTTTLPNGVVGTPYNATVTSTGGSGAITWSLPSGALPLGIVGPSSTGVLSGTPATAGTYTFTISAKDSASSPNTITQTYTITIAPKPPTITPAILPNALAGVPYSQQLAYTGGSGTPTWAITTGSLPPSLTLNPATGLISGTVTNAGAGATYSFTVTVTAGTQTSPAAAFTVTVPALPLISTTSLPSGNIGIPYTQQLAYTGGAGGTVTWAIVSGSLPSNSGLALNTSTGVITGTPTTATTYTFSIAVTVGTQTSIAQAYTLTINSLIIISGATATGEVNLPFSFCLTAAGGTAPYTWSLATGSAPLPATLTLNATTGCISGTPNTNTGSPFTNIVVEAIDSKSATATQAMTITINPARTIVNNAELNGQYAFLLSGFDANGKPMSTAGKFTADGNGNIISGTIDTNGTGLSAASSATLNATTYAIGSDNRGKLTLTTAAGSATFTLALNTLTSGIAAAGYLTECDSTGQTRTGVLALQTPAAFTTASITGGYAFGLSGFASNSTPTALHHRSTIGEIQFNGTGGITSAEYLASSSSTTTPTVPTTAAINVASNGRGTLSLTLPNTGGTLNFALYVVSTGKFFLVSSDPASGTAGINDLLFGQALQQTTLNGNFSAASLNGTSVMRSQKLDVTTAGLYYPDAQLGLFTFNGVGKITLTGDEDAGGTVSSTSLSGTYTVAANGRVTTILGAPGIGGCSDCLTLQSYFYLVGANQGFMMDFSTPATEGYFTPQTTTIFSASSLTGNYTIGSIEPLTQNATYLSGVLTSAGSGSISGTIDLNTDGTLTPDTPSIATYTVGTTGRTSLTQAGANPVLYIISPTQALLFNLSSTDPVIEEILHQ
jgi:hypothetical protein